MVLQKCGGNTNAMEHGLLLLGKSDVDWDAQPGVVETQDLKGLEISTVTGEGCCGSGEAVMRGSRTSALLWARPRPAATTGCLLFAAIHPLLLLIAGPGSPPSFCCPLGCHLHGAVSSWGKGALSPGAPNSAGGL